jgi:hypothetical protein
VQKKTTAPTTKIIPKGECLMSPKNYSPEASCPLFTRKTHLENGWKV